ncbi:MAG: M23 family metallopeptidase [Spirochaetota bacterium]
MRIDSERYRQNKPLSEKGLQGFRFKKWVRAGKGKVKTSARTSINAEATAAKSGLFTGRQSQVNMYSSVPSGSRPFSGAASYPKPSPEPADSFASRFPVPLEEPLPPEFRPTFLPTQGAAARRRLFRQYKPISDTGADLSQGMAESDSGFWDVLAGVSQGLLYFLRWEGLLFLSQLILFSLLLQQYLPPLSRYYFNRSAKVLLLPLEGGEDGLEELLSEDILLTDVERADGMGGGEIHIAAINTAANPAAKPGKEPLKEPWESTLYPAYRTRDYIVKSGENISLLALRYHIKMSTLISVNRIERAKSLRAGQKLLIPNMDGLLYEIQNEDNLSKIAQKFEISMGSIIDANRLESEQLAVGSQIFIPGATLSSYELRKVFGSLYIYPHVGRFSSRFGYRRDPFRSRKREFHNGLDIVGPRGAPIKASSDGTVVSAGYHRIYGNYVILEHAKGIKSLYGHMSKRLVNKGQRVMQGEVIGRIGSSGRSTGPHVHFTIFMAGKAVNPLDYLSGPQ